MAGMAWKALALLALCVTVTNAATCDVFNCAGKCPKNGPQNENSADLQCAGAECTCRDCCQLLVATTCGQGFDTYMIVDHSGSTANVFDKQVTKMVTRYLDIFSNFTGFRLGIEIFGTGTSEMLPITSSLKNINQVVEDLKYQFSRGSTHAERAFESVYFQMRQQPKGKNKIVWFVTDGLNYGPDTETVYWAELMRMQGATIFSVGIVPENITDPNTNKQVNIEPDMDVLTAVACGAKCPHPAYVTRLTEFQQLLAVFDKVQKSFICTKIDSLGSGIDCPPFQKPVLLQGSAFGTFAYRPATPTADCDAKCQQTIANKETAKAMTCRYLYENGNGTQAMDVPVTEYIDDKQVICGAPTEPLWYPSNLELRLTDTVKFTEAGHYVEVYNASNDLCVPPTFPWWILLIIIPLVLFLIWWFFPLLPKKKQQVAMQEEVIQSPEILATIVAPLQPTAPALPPPDLPPPKTKKKIRKWAKVDTTHYIWSRDGGTARPMECNWGATGAPESAPVGKGDMVYEVTKDPEPIVQAPVVQLSVPAPVMAAPPPVNVTPDDGDFEDLEWDKCCGGRCKSSACDPCKRCMSRSFLFAEWLGKATSAFCYAVCKPCTPCLRCYQWCDSKRPRPNCCGVDRTQQAPSGSSSTEMKAMKGGKGGGGPLPAGWEELKSENGDIYYYNEKTDTSRPAELRGDATSCGRAWRDVNIIVIFMGGTSDYSIQVADLRFKIL